MTVTGSNGKIIDVHQAIAINITIIVGSIPYFCVKVKIGAATNAIAAAGGIISEKMITIIAKIAVKKIIEGVDGNIVCNQVTITSTAHVAVSIEPNPTNTHANIHTDKAPLFSNWSNGTNLNDGIINITAITHKAVSACTHILDPNIENKINKQIEAIRIFSFHKSLSDILFIFTYFS